MAVGQRFDFEAARREAKAKKAAEKRKAIISNVVLAVVVICMAIGVKLGWDWYSEKRRIAEEEAQMAQAAEERRVAAENAKREAERKAEAARREAERKAAEERREAERKAQIEARQRENEAREEARRLAEENRMREREEAQRLRQNRSDCEAFVKGMRDSFNVANHVIVEHALRDAVEVTVDGKRWTDLSSAATTGATIDFVELLRTSSITNSFNEENYPDADTIAQMKESLMKERFRAVVETTAGGAKARKLVLVAFDNDAPERLSKGGINVAKDLYKVAEPKGNIRAFKFVFGDAADDRDPCPRLFVMSQDNFNAMKREFNDLCKQALKDAERAPDRRDAIIAEAIVDYMHLIKKGLETPVREVETKPQETTKPVQKKPKASLGGANSDIRSFGGSGSRRRLR